MNNKGKIAMAAGLAAGIVTFLITRRKRAKTKPASYRFFKKSRHLTPAFAKVNKYS
jgi:hypothetical protein